MARQFLGRALVLGSLMALSLGAVAQRDDDPEEGQSWLTQFNEQEARDGRQWSGTIRATDDFGATHDRDFRLKATGSIDLEDRAVVLNRYEPECFELSAAARMSLDDYCDQLTLTWRDGDATIAFSSLDANRRYTFTLRADPRAPGEWMSLTPEVPAPTLRLVSGVSGGDVSYRWELGTRDASYRQAGEVTASQLRGPDLHPLEAGLLGLGEVLLTFNRHAFERSLLPRDHANYEPTPYSAWAEETVEGGCIFAFCFGNLGGGGGGAGNNNNACSPGSPSYNPTLCPYDLTFARWPVAMRPKLIKLNNDEVIFSFAGKNVGTGPTTMPRTPGANFAHLSLIGVGSAAPLVSPGVPSPYGNSCQTNVQDLYGEIVNPFLHVDLAAGESKLRADRLRCPASSGRPAGRYRLYIHIDPSGLLDTPGYAGNNIGNSGLLDWVHLRD